MKKELINDSRLTPTMRRIRSGKTQLFREHNPEDRSFIRPENCDVQLKHERPEMYADLIDGEWYWVNGCNACNGKSRFASYVECDEHNVCSTCSRPRSDFKDVWGGNDKGWICDPCKRLKDAEVRAEAFSKLDGQAPDHEYTDSPICPHCGSSLGQNIYESEDTECYVCEGKVKIEVQHSPVYVTSIIGDRVTE